MGFRRQGTIFRLKFDDPELAGLQVEARSLPLGRMLRVLTAVEQLETSREARGDSALDSQAITEIFDVFADALVGWNLEDDNGPVPATRDGLYAQDFEFVLTLVLAWVEAVAGVSAPLGRGSDDGQPSPGVSLPMEPLSASRRS